MLRLTRRHLLKTGAAAFAAGALRRPAPALAAVPLFERGLDDELSRAVAASGDGWHVTRALAAPRRFDLLGVRWAPGTGSLDVEVRARRRRAAWSPWYALPHAHGHAPDGEDAPAGTEPAYTGTADEFQMRWRGGARDVRMRFVRGQPAARLAQRLAARRPRPRQSAVSRPDIISRAEWGADVVGTRGEPQYGQVAMAFVHHTVGRNDYSAAESAGIVLAITRFHVNSNGWNDMGYNFLVDRHGQVFEGRGGGVEQAVVGAQAQGYNSVSTGVACLGTFTSVAQSGAGMTALARLIGWKLSLHGVPVGGPITVTSAGGPANRYAAGTQVTFQRIAGHRDADATTCPGDRLYGQLAGLRTRAASFAGPVAGVTMRVADTVIRHPERLSLAGTVRLPGGETPAGVRIDVQLQPVDGGPFASIASATTAGGGSWSASVAPPASGRLRAVFAGDRTRAMTSAMVDVWIYPTITLAKLRTVRPRTLVPVTATVAPSGVESAVVVLEKLKGRRWSRVQRKVVTLLDGTLDTEVRPRSRGRHRVTVVAGGTAARRRFRASWDVPAA